jgi:hypothetical protein
MLKTLGIILLPTLFTVGLLIVDFSPAVVHHHLAASSDTLKWQQEPQHVHYLVEASYVTFCHNRNRHEAGNIFLSDRNIFASYAYKNMQQTLASNS